jgi:nucleotide-binding universal stress UspA family protein
MFVRALVVTFLVMHKNMCVLVAVDGSTSSLDACRTLMNLLPATADIRLLTVLSYSDYPRSLMGGRLADEGRRADAAQRTAAAAQDAAREMFIEAGYDVTVVHRFGFPPNEIMAELDEHAADLLAVGRRDLDRANWRGSVSDRIIRRAQVPVLLVT